MLGIIATWNQQEASVVEAAYERLNPVTRMSTSQAQKWWDFIGAEMVQRGKLSHKLQPMRDIFDLSLQAV